MRTFTIMNKYVTQWNALAVSAAIVLFSSVAFVLSIARSRSGDFAAVSRHAATPKTILWAWERPTDLTFIDPQQVGVAFLAQTIRLKADDVVVKPRLQTLGLPVSAKLIAVARIESDLKNRPTLSASQKDALVTRISEMAVQPNVDNIQIDFDATQSEREFYRTVILGVRLHLPDQVGLSITALASWCTDADWLSDMPIDEAVPMLFRMGVDRQQIVNRLASGEQFSAKPCRSSYGISTDEPMNNLAADKRIYVFSPTRWTAELVEQVLERRK